MLNEMAGPRLLLAWAMATFHVVVFLVLVLLYGFVTGGLGDALASSSTLLGLGLFAVLWAVVSFAMARALRDVDFGRGSSDTRFDNLVVRGVRAGGEAGVLFFGILLVVGGTAFLVLATAAGDSEAIAGTVAGLIIVGDVGVPPAWVIGGTIGLVFAFVDAFLLYAARGWLALR